MVITEDNKIRDEENNNQKNYKLNRRKRRGISYKIITTIINKGQLRQDIKNRSNIRKILNMKV